MDNSKNWAATKYAQGGEVTASDPQYGMVSYENNPTNPPRYAGGGAIKGYASAGSVKKAADITSKVASKLMKPSEALAPKEGAWVVGTQSDRTKLGGNYKGGPGFTLLQTMEPEFKDIVWGVDSPSALSRLLNLPEALELPKGDKVYFTTKLGSETMHMGNKAVFDATLKKFKQAAKEGLLDPTLHREMNARLSMVKNRFGKNVFPEDVDILSPDFKKIANTFEKRRVASMVIGGKGVGGQKGQIFDYNKHVLDTTDPELIGAPTESLGPRLFTLSGESSYRPDLYEAFPHMAHGEVDTTAFTPIPWELALKNDYMDRFMRLRAEKGQELRMPGSMDFTRGHEPFFQIREDLLRGLEDAGYAKGGEVKGYKKGGNLEDEFRKADTIDMTGFRRDPMAEAVYQTVNKENPYLGVGRRLKKLASLPVEIGKGIGEATGQELKHIFTSPTGKRDYGVNLAAELASQLEESEPLAKLYRTYKGEKPLRGRIMGDTKELPFTTLLPQMVSPVAASKKGISAIKNLVKSFEGKDVGMSIKPVGGQWMTNRLDKELEGIAMPDTDAELNKAINGWIRGPLRKYLMNRMGTESDELLKLYDAGIYHKDPYHIQGYPIDADAEDLPKYMDKIRSHWYPSGKTNAKTPEGFRWEMTSELALRPRTAREVKDSPLLREQAPWVEKLDPNEIVYGLGSSGYDGDTLRNLGFEHIIDVLKNDIREGKLRPEQLNKVSIEDAAKRTHQYNVEMAKKAEDAGVKIQQGLPIHREYPEGYKWVELKHPEGDKKRLDEIDALLYGNKIGGEWKPRQYGSGEIYLYKEDPYTKVQGVPANQTLVDSSGRPKFFSSLEEAEAEAGNLNSKGRLSEDDVKALQEERSKLTKEYAKERTQEALTYEGDTMGHCVGSYCEDVMSGDTRIFSLRDSNGRPHVTIEVTGKDAPSFYQANQHLFESNPELKDFVEYVNDTSGSESEFIDDVTRKMKQLGIEPVAPEGSYYIKQIKGKGNAKPADKYIPYVQDFVKNPVVDNDWAGVGDFRNTNLIDVRKMREHGVLPDMDTEGTNQILQEIDRLYPTAKTPTGGLVFENEYGRLIPNTDMLKYEVQDLPSPYLTKEDIIEHLRKREPRSVEQSYSKYYETPKEEGMKKGGSALTKTKSIIKNLVDEFSGAAKIDEPTTIRTEKALPRNVAYNTYEQVPYAYSKHLEGMPEKSYAEKLDFTNEANWEQDGDLLAKYLGMKAEPSQRGVGLYTPPVEGAATEMNPQISTRTRVKTDQDKRWRNQMTQESQGSMSAMGATRGYFDVQGASPWVRPSEGGKRKYNAFHVEINGKPTQEEMLKLGEIQSKYGFEGTSDLGKSGVFIGFNFDYGPKELKAMREAFKADVKEALGDRVKNIRMVKSEGDYPGFEGAWGIHDLPKNVAGPKRFEGSGAATRQFMQYLDAAKEQNPLLAEFYAQRPSTELQKLMESMNIRDINAPEKFGVGAPRKDVLNARDIFAREGIEGLRKALEGGAYLPAVGAIGLEGLDDKR